MTDRNARGSIRIAAATFLALTTAFAAMSADSASAADGTWINAGGGDYTISGNWQGGVVPNGAGDHADFSTLNITSDVSVALNSDITLGRMSFGDTNTGSGGSWELATTADSTVTLDNGGSKPVVTANPLVPATTFDDTFLGVNLAGMNGFAKEGGGILTIAGTANTITGGIDVNAGTLRVSSAVPAQALNLGNGTTLDARVDIRFGAGINVGSGNTANIIASGGVDLGTMNAMGATVNLNVVSGASVRAADNWAANGSMAALNITGDDSASNFGFWNNGGSYSGASLAGTAVNLDNIIVWTRTNSGGNTNQIGALSGTSTAFLSGGGQSGGSFANYQIGALNTDTTFAGTIDTTSAPAPNSNDDLGGLNLTKVGTGTLTLSGTLAYQPTANSTVGRRGGITTISAGTLALTNSAAIPGGVVTERPSTINVQAAGTLDVSGFSGSYSTAAFQQIVGAGTIAGNFTHDEGVIRPGNTISSNNPASNAVAGTLNFSNNFAWSGGEYVFDLTDNPVSGNDLISVAGSTTLSGGAVTPNFIGNVPTAGTTFTLLTSTGGITGSPASISVAWDGRGADPVPFISGNSLQFTVPVGGADLVWRGNDGTNPTFWDIETTGNWTGASPNTFFQNDSVTFDDTATGFAVDLQANVEPNSVTINNSTNAYTFTSSGGAITGITGLVKTGSGDVTMDVDNTFSGAAQLSGGGTIDIVGRDSALGEGALELNGVTIRSTASGASLSNSSLAVTGVNTIQADDVVGSGSQFNIPTLTGDGTLTLTTSVGNAASGNEQDGKWFVLSDTTGFTGTLNITGPAPSQEGITVRILYGDTNLGGAVLNLSNAKIANRDGEGSPTPNRLVAIGELHGDADSELNGFIGGSSGRPNIDWEIGALNTNSDFAGDITDPGGGNNAQSFVRKVGTGSLTLTGVKSYTGDTTVEAGTLSIDDQVDLADGADVYLSSAALLNLNFGSLAIVDTIDSLFINGVSQATGTWGRIGSGATNESSLLTGDGLLMVTTQDVLAGDFDLDGDVDGADFLTWQRGVPGTYGAADLADWESNYGAGTPAAVNLGGATAAVPEPATVLLAIAGFAGTVVAARRRW